MFSEETRREAMERARDTGAPAATGRVHFVPEIDAATFEQHADTAKDSCPVSNALKGNVEINLKATLA